MNDFFVIIIIIIIMFFVVWSVIFILTYFLVREISMSDIESI
jgi:hypothetical protein